MQSMSGAGCWGAWLRSLGPLSGLPRSPPPSASAWLWGRAPFKDFTLRTQRDDFPRRQNHSSGIKRPGTLSAVGDDIILAWRLSKIVVGMSAFAPFPAQLEAGHHDTYLVSRIELACSVLFKSNGTAV